MNIILCGMMGCGKTTVANVLAEKLNFSKIDTDGIIVSKYGVINDIFERYGEEYFRNLESRVVKDISSDCDNAVISLGGGCVLRTVNVENLKKCGKIVYLKARAETLAKRLEGDTSRPLLKGGATEKITSILSVRAPVYESAADFTVETDGRAPEEIAQIIKELFGL